jgi:hypothetical protein
VHKFKFKFKFATTKIPRQCPFILLVTACSVMTHHFEVQKVSGRVQQGDKLSWVLLHSYTISNFVTCLGVVGGGGVGGRNTSE